MKRATPIILPFVWLASIGTGDAERVTLTYDANGRHVLHAYDVKPAKSAGSTEPIKGSPDDALTVRKPDETYFCVWRDTGPDGFANRRSGSGRPSEIFLTCRFGTNRRSPPADLVEAAVEMLKQENALIRIGWKKSANGYVLKRFELELRGHSALNFRSQNLTDAEVSQLGIRVRDMIIPATRRSDLTIHLTARIPSRMNSGMKAIGPIIPVEIEGTAMPIPTWMSY